MDTGEAVVDEEDEECDALFTMDDLQDGTANAKQANTEEVSRFTLLGHTGTSNSLIVVLRVSSVWKHKHAY